MCFEIVTGRITGRKFLVIDGVRYSPGVKIGDMLETLAYIEKNGGEAMFQQKVKDLVKHLKPSSLENLKELKYGVRLLDENYDIYNDLGDIIFKGPSKYFENFLYYSKIEGDELRRLRLQQVIEDTKEELEDFIFNRELFKRATGIDYPEIITRGNGYAPDFDLLPDELIDEFIYLGNRENANITIKMSGNYIEDFKRALEAAKIPIEDLPKEQLKLLKEAGEIAQDVTLPNGQSPFAPFGFVWHHLDDFDPVKGTCTMQLVRKELHEKLIKAPAGVDIINFGTEHSGACAIWKRYFDIVGYRY